MTGSASRNDLPLVIVTGLPRSGTSMMMRMLEAGGMPVLVDGLRKADIDNPNGYYEYEPVKTLKQHSAWVHDSRGSAVKMVYLLLRDLPPSMTYDVIFMRRNLEEVVASQDTLLRHAGSNVPAEESSRLKTLFRQELASIEQWLNARDNFRVLHIDYNATIANPGDGCAAIKEFLRRDLDETRMQAVVTPSLYRQRRTPV